MLRTEWTKRLPFFLNETKASIWVYTLQPSVIVTTSEFMGWFSLRVFICFTGEKKKIVLGLDWMNMEALGEFQCTTNTFKVYLQML